MRHYDYRVLENGTYEQRLFEKTNKVLISNFNKVAKWVEKNCPRLNGTFKCRHNSFYWVALVVENGKAYLEEGSHGHNFQTALSTTETAVFSSGSCQRNPYAYGKQFFRNDRLEEFLKQWREIKSEIIAENDAQNEVYSDDFRP